MKGDSGRDLSKGDGEIFMSLRFRYRCGGMNVTLSVKNEDAANLGVWMSEWGFTY